MLVSISDGFCLEGLLGAILFSALDDMFAACEVGSPRLSACQEVPAARRIVSVEWQVRLSEALGPL